MASGWFVDLHSHVCPSGDDGAQSMAEGADLCVAAARHGTRTLFATPHVAAHVPPDEEREALVAERVEELRARTGVDLRLGWELTPIAELLGPVHLLEPFDDVHRHPDRPRLVRERARDGLTDPPRRVGRELVAPAPVELLDRPDQPQRPLLDQVEERQALVAVVLRDRDDEAEVGLDHPLLRLLVAALDPPADVLFLEAVLDEVDHPAPFHSRLVRHLKPESTLSRCKPAALPIVS